MKHMKRFMFFFCILLLFQTPLFVAGAQEDSFDTEHHWGPWIVDREPTCTSEGSRHRVCDKYPSAPHSERESIPKLNHRFRTSEKKPGCTEPGWKITACIRCGLEKEKEKLAPLGHDYGPWEVTKKATYTEEGSEEHVCNRDATHVETRIIPVKIKEKETPTPGLFEFNKADAVIGTTNAALLGVLLFLIVPDIAGILWVSRTRRAYRALVRGRLNQ